MGDTPQMLGVAEARARILEHFVALGSETVPIGESAGRVLASDVSATHDLPPFANSSMDGYAVRASEVAGASFAGPTQLAVSADIPAGAGLPAPLASGTAARIMTGAPVPAGADAVVPVEDTDDSRERAGEPPPAQVQIRVAPSLGANIRPAGQDMRAGQTVLRAGAVLSPAAVGVLAGLGVSQVPVHARPLVAVFSTGDELRRVDQDLGPGQIRDTNSYALAAAAADYGARVVRLEVARDRLGDVRARFDEALRAGAQLIISSAGVSVGAYDVVKAAVEAEGALSFWRVRMRPGKPLAFGQVRGVPFFGLPGNPVSALVGFEVFVRPAILKMAGRRRWEKLAIVAELLEPLESDGRESYLRVIVERRGAGYVARASGNQGSAVMSSLVRANGLLIMPEGVTRGQPGEQFSVWLVDGADSGIDTFGES
jgi:molybdopterin molybdotransferase